MPKFKVGDKVMVLDVNFPTRKSIIGKVGHKYLYLQGDLRTAFDIETGRIHDAYGHQRVITLDEYSRSEKLQKAKEDLGYLGLRVESSVAEDQIFEYRKALEHILARRKPVLKDKTEPSISEKLPSRYNQNCHLVIPGTFIACGEGDNFCSEECLRAAGVRSSK